MHEIKHFMTQSPHAIGHDQSLKLAHERMLHAGMHHIPVLDGGELVGVLSERDIALLAAISPKNVEETTAEEAMSTEPYAVEPNSTIESVTTHMAEHKLACAVVMEHHKVVGVFTATDALRLLAVLLHETKDAGWPERVVAAQAARKPK